MMTTETLLLGPFRTQGPAILLMALFFYAVQKLSVVFGRKWVKGFSAMGKKEQEDFAVRVVSVLHCLVTFATIPGYLYPAWENSFFSSPTSPASQFFSAIGFLNPPVYLGNEINMAFGLPETFPETPTPEEFQATVYSYSPVSQLFFAVTAGYFLWDIFISVGYGWGAFFITHAFASFGVYYFSLFPFLHYFGRYFHGVFEISTIWLHFREMLALLKREDSFFYDFFGKVFAVSFIIVRVVLGCYVSFLLWLNCLELIGRGKSHSDSIIWFLLGGDFVVMCLQIFWFFKLLEQALGISIFPKTAEAKPLKIE